MSTIPRIEDLDLHDSPIKSMKVDVDEKTLGLIVLKFDDNKDDYYQVVLTFNGVEQTSIQTSDQFVLTSEWELMGIDIEVLNDGRYTASIVTLLGFGKPSFVITFEFSNCDIS